MAVSFVKKTKLNGFTSLILSAACEWFLILLLFADALFSHLITKFARYCELQAPCPLCTRLDCLFAKRKQEHYWGLICCKHKAEISSLVSCDAKKLPELKPAVFGPSKPSPKPPLPRGPGQGRLRRRVSLRRLRDNKFTRKTMHRHNGFDTLSDVGYSKLKISTDSESEFPFSDDDDGYASYSSEKFFVPTNDFEFHRRGNVVSYKQTRPGCEIGDQPNLLELNELKNAFTASLDPRSTMELFSLHDVPEGNSGVSAVSELLSLQNVPSSSDTVTLSNKSINKPPAINTEDSNDTRSSESNNDNNNNTEIMDSSRAHEIVEPIYSNSGRTEGGIKDINPIVKAEHDESKMKRNDSSYESLVGDIEGENLIDRLKRQAEHEYRARMNALYEELEEERNAAAVAANQAMSMITRLQEEKAELHMEALQYLRMMEEQAEYDMEALRRANDLLAEKEKEVQDLEYELEFYKGKSCDVSAGTEDCATTHFGTGPSTYSDLIAA